jgi:hypothetical protein
MNVSFALVPWKSWVLGTLKKCLIVHYFHEIKDSGLSMHLLSDMCVQVVVKTEAKRTKTVITLYAELPNLHCVMSRWAARFACRYRHPNANLHPPSLSLST